MKKWIKRLLINLIPVILIAFNVDELIQMRNPKNDYPFGSDFFATYSIYSSESIYLAYLILFIITLSLIILADIMKRKRMYFFLLTINLFLLLYPLFTNE